MREGERERNGVSERGGVREGMNECEREREEREGMNE